MKSRRFFLAHPKGLSDEELDALVARADEALRSLAAGRAEVVIVTGKADFDARWSQVGSWEAWAREVVMGKVSFGSDEPRYHAVVVTHPTLGNATRLIVQTALAAGRPVLRLHDDGTLSTVSLLVMRDQRDWQRGWETR